MPVKEQPNRIQLYTNISHAVGVRFELTVVLRLQWFSRPSLSTTQAPHQKSGEAGIRTLDRAITPYKSLANFPFQPLRHLSEYFYFTSKKHLNQLDSAPFLCSLFSTKLRDKNKKIQTIEKVRG